MSSQKAINNEIDEREDQFLVGREEEITIFQHYLNHGIQDSKSIWNIHGTAGVGKSFLLDRFRRQALQAGVQLLHLDSRDFNHQGDLLCLNLIKQVPYTYRKDLDDSEIAHNSLEACLGLIRKLAAAQKVVLAFDTFEEMAELDFWLREHLCKRLPDSILILIVGRYRLKDQWVISPALRERILFMPLGHLTNEESTTYLNRSGFTDAELIRTIQTRTGGHPLALSLAASIPMNNNWAISYDDQAEWFDHLVKAWLREVPEAAFRSMVEAAAVLLHFNREVLVFVMEQDIHAAAFDSLLSLSFVRRTEKGWMLHDLMRLATRKQLEERTPQYYEKLMGRAAQYYASLIRRSSPYRQTEWEVSSLFYYTTGNVLLRSVLQISRGHYAWEALTLSNLAEGEAYLRNRHEETTPLSLSVSDPETEQPYSIFIDEAELALTIKGLDLCKLVALDKQGAMLLRGEAGEVVGLASIIPINSATLPYLNSDPFAQPYLSSLSAFDQRRLEVPSPGQAGWFIRTIDYADWNNLELVIEAMYLMFSYMFSGGLFIASPPPMPFFSDIHLNMGFQIVPGVYHKHYDGKTPTPTFVLDTRGEKRESFLQFLLRQSGFIEESELPSDNHLKSVLTEREREVVSLVLDGLSNLKIGKSLFISEITVKKHISSIFSKLSVKNRSELSRLFNDISKYNHKV